MKTKVDLYSSDITAELQETKQRLLMAFVTSGYGEYLQPPLGFTGHHSCLESHSGNCSWDTVEGNVPGYASITVPGYVSAAIVPGYIAEKFHPTHPRGNSSLGTVPRDPSCTIETFRQSLKTFLPMQY